MTPPEFDASVHRLLGELVAGQKGLADAFRRSEDKADESRATMHRRMDDLVDRVGRVEGSVSTVTDDIAEMKPVTEDVKKWRLMGMGALAIVGIGGTALGASLAGVLEKLAHTFKG